MSIKSSSFLSAVHAVQKSDEKKTKSLHKVKVKPIDTVVKDIKGTPPSSQKLVKLFTLKL